MTALENVLSQEIVQKLGWTLVHFVWQAAAVALLLAVVLRLLQKSSANLRYITACLALTLMVLLPVMTMRAVNVSTADTVTTQAPVTESAINVTEGIPIAEMAVIPPQAESITASPRISWRQRAASTIEPALPYIVAGWLLGVLGLSVWHLGGWTQLQRLRRRMVKPVNASLHSKLRELAQTLGINRAVELAESALVGVPTVVGWLKPVILLPASALTGLSSEQLEAILAHELAHIKRGDYLVNILQTVVEILGFYHPAVWWVSGRIRAERENCCDDLAVSIFGDRIRYARALTSMAEIRAGYGLAVAATGGNLFHRICRLVGKNHANEGKLSWLPSVIAILLIAALLIPTALALTSKAKPDTDNPVGLVSVKPADITREVLAEICEAMESSIVDVSVDYEWYVDPPTTLKDIAGTGVLIDKGRKKFQLITARPFADRLLSSYSGAFMNANGDSWHSTVTSSYNGRISKQLTIGSSLRPDYTDGAVYGDRRFVPSMNLTPLGFSVLRLGFSKVVDKTPLSAVLREHEELVRLDNTVAKVNGFDTIRADLLTEWNKMLFMRIYFSVDHGYTPVKYEYMNGPKVSISVAVTSLQRVAKGLWFPAGGKIVATGDKSFNVYRATGKIIVNQGLSDEIFDIEFPAGTEVNDEVQGTEYIVKPTKQQKQRRAKEAEELAKFLKEHPEQIQEMERRGTSFGNLHKLGGMRDMYMTSSHKELPKTLSELEPYSTGNEAIFAWLLENVTYIGYDGSLSGIDSRNTPLAYDRTMLESGRGTTVLFINGMVKFVKPAQLEKLGIKTAVQGAVDAKTAIQVYARFLLVPIDANEFNNFFEDESLEAAPININDDPNLKSYFLDDEQTQRLLKLANTNPGSKMLAAPKVRVNDGEEATMRLQRTIRYTGAADNSDQPEVKEVPVGTIIAVKPTLQADGEKILLELDFEQSNFLGFENELPQTEIVRIKTRISIANGSTLLLGGQKMTTQQDGQEVLKTLFCLVKAELQ